MTYDDLQAQARERQLIILGGFHPTSQDKTPEGTRTMLMLGPDEPAFWPAFEQSTEALDGAPDPIDRWSTRIIGDWARTLDAKPLYPFGGPPYLPFFSWATRTGRVHSSPVMWLVHDHAGLFVSFRGALALDRHIDLPHSPPNPCIDCKDQPCRIACPVDAFSATDYDVPRCKGHLATPEGQETCMALGCAARRACPISQRFGRLPAQSAYHMRMFNPS